MREIRFRAWNGAQMRFIEDGEILLNHQGLLAPDEMYEEWTSRDWPLMQYTGLKDKNGKEIYEGDVIRWKYESDSPNSFQGVVEYADRIIKVGWEHDDTRFVGFTIRCDDKGEEWFAAFPNLKDIEIIGNIYENPELLAD
jgi:uncharacterized phage protein (TIGR01671 family)